MNVKQLIEELQKYPIPEAEVYLYYEDDIDSIEMVDLSGTDRVDINSKDGVDSILDNQ